MCNALVWSFEAITGLPWLEMVKALASVAVAVVAWRALANWKKQEKAKRQADFLDQMMEALHSFIGLMPGPISTVQLIKIGMSVHTPRAPKHDDPNVAAAIEYIEKRGPDDYKHVSGELEKVRPAYFRLQSLVAKGQVFGFENYIDCQNAIAQLGGQFTRAQGLATLIHSSSYYWENPDIIVSLKKCMNVDAVEMQKLLDENSLAMHRFLRDTYERVFR